MIKTIITIGIAVATLMSCSPEGDTLNRVELNLIGEYSWWQSPYTGGEGSECYFSSVIFNDDLTTQEVRNSLPDCTQYEAK